MEGPGVAASLPHRIVVDNRMFMISLSVLRYETPRYDYEQQH